MVILSERNDWNKQHEQWVREVRDPAEKFGEGLRVIEVDGASAEYDIAPLPDGRFAVRSSFSYDCGDYHGSVSPWLALESRAACVDVFVNRARNHFCIEFFGGSTIKKQHRAQKLMMQALEVGLFGFIEPEVSEEAAKRDREIREIVKQFRPA